MVKVACIGIGNWGKNLFRVFNTIRGCHVACCCDLEKSKISKLNVDNLDLMLTTDLGQILQNPSINAVVISTPVKTHYEITKAALSAGKDVFVEKPLALCTKEASELVKLAKEKKSILMVGHLLVYHPAVRKIKQLIDSGEIGRVYYIYSQRVNLGQIRQYENALWSFAPHDMSIITYLLSEGPDNVSARGQGYLNKDREDVVFVYLEYKDKRIAHVQLSWLDPHKIRRTTIVGSKKMVVFDDMEAADKIKIYDKGVEKEDFDTYGDYLTLRFGGITIPHLDMVEPLKLECQHFIECVANRKTPHTDGANGLEIVRIIEAADRSLKNNGMPVKL